MKKSLFLFIDRRLAGKWHQQLLFPAITCLLVLGVVGAIYFYRREGSFVENFAQAFADMTNPESMRSEVYDTIQPQYNEIANNLDLPEKTKKPDPTKTIGLVIIYVFGTIAFTGLLIATITSIWRSRSERFRRGTVKYRFSNHIVILGYNGLVPGMIQRICEQKQKDIRIVVGVEDHASTICDKIKNRLYEDYRNLIVVLKADSCNRKDLTRLRITHASEVFIIGEHDDAYNLKCYRTIYELSLCDYSRGVKMPKCYVNLHSQATLTLFRTYASADELGVDFTQFHSFSFYDEWARLMIMKTLDKKWNIDRNLQIHLIIAGMTEMGIAIARKTVLLCHKPNKDKRTIVTLVDNNIVMKSKLFITQNQDFFDRCHYTIQTRKDTFKHEPEAKMDLLDVMFEFIEGDLTDEAIREKLSAIAIDPNKAKILAICYDNPQQNIAMGLSLPKVFYNENRDAEYKSIFFKNAYYKNVGQRSIEETDIETMDLENKFIEAKDVENKDVGNEARLWIYQPASGDLGKYLESDRYARCETFGMSGYKLNIRNEECTKTAKCINHFFLHKKDSNIDFSPKTKTLIETEWEGTDIAKRWICIRHAEFIPFLAKYNDNDSEMANLERNRSAADIFLFGEESLYSLKSDFYPKYIDVLKTKIADDKLTSQKKQQA